MRIIFIIIKKELKQIFRNKGMLPIIFGLPIIQLLILANATNYEIRNINLAILDYGENDFTSKLAYQLELNDFFNIKSVEYDYPSAQSLIDAGKVDALIVLHNDLQWDNVDQEPQIQLIINTIDGASAGVILSYLSDFLRAYTNSTSQENFPLELTYTNRFNPKLDYKTVMVPGILVVLVSVISLFLTAMNIVREKEIGTIDQINVTPISQIQLIAGKMLPMLLIALGELAFGILLGRKIYAVPFEGNPLVILVFALAYLWIMLSLGLLISNKSETQQQAMLMAYLFLVIFIMFSGLFTAIESMPTWANYISQSIPVTHFIKVMRSVMLKATPLEYLHKELLILLGMGGLLFSLAVRVYRKN